MNSIASHKHQDFLQATLPSWYVYTSAAMRERLHRDMIRGQHIREQLGRALKGLKGLDEFARPLLTCALDKAFGPGLDVDKDHFFHVRFEDSTLPLPGRLQERSATVQTLLEAALQNFHQYEVDEVRAESVIYKGKPTLGAFANGSSYPHPLKAGPAKFMALCRKLDLGGKYQAHLNSVLEPEAKGSRVHGFSAGHIKELISHQQRNGLYVAAHIAHMQGESVLGSKAYRAVLAAASHGGSHDFAAAATVLRLGVLGFSVRDVLVFQIPQSRTCAVYIPGDPAGALTEYDSIEHFTKALRARLRVTAYQNFFAGFIAQRSRGAFVARLRSRLTPHVLRRIPGDDGLIPKMWKVPEDDPNADLQILTEQVPYTLLEYFYFQRMLRIKDDARALAVPTGDEDEESRRNRLASYLNMGLNIANLAALFVPVLGEVMMVVGGSQLLVETFEGVEAWAHGDMEEALGHLASVAENVAMLAVFAAAGKMAAPSDLPVIKPSSFVGTMIPVRLPDGATRLWFPDLTAFATDVELPAGLRPSAEGVFVHQGQHFIALEDHVYPIAHDAALNKWRIKPVGRKGLSPILEHNGAGAWRHEGENPAGWGGTTAFRRLGHSVEGLSDQALEDLMAITGTDESMLTALHLDNQAPPPALRDAVGRYAVDQQVLAFNEQISDVGKFEAANPALQAHLLPSIPGWPKNGYIHVLDAATLEMAEQGVHIQLLGKPILVKEAQIAEGKLLTAVFDGLSRDEKLAIFGPHTPPTPFNLALEIGRLSGSRMLTQFEFLNQLRETSADPLVGLIKRDFPGLSTAAARELLLEADAQQLEILRIEQRVPLGIAGRARGYLQEARLNQALEGFFMASRAGNPDTQKLALHLLTDFPGWPSDLRIELRDGSSAAPLLDSVGEDSSARRRVLIKQGQRYRLLDAAGTGQQTADSLGDGLFASIWRALPEDARQTLGFGDAEVLRSRLIERATRQRTRAARILGLREMRPGFRGPRRLADGRFGYVLSGRGTPFSTLPPATDEWLASLRILYPEAADLAGHVENLILRGYAIDQMMEQTQARLVSYEIMRSALEGWVNPAGPGPSISNQQLTVRRAVADAISRAWRYSLPQSPMFSSNLLLENIDLNGFSGLPDLPAHYRELQYLTLSNVTADSAQLDRFLGRFPAVNRLEIIGRGVTELPDGLAAMTGLNHLSLEGLGLTIDQHAMDLIMQLPLLDELDLSGNVIGEFADIERLRVSTLWLNDTGLTRWPEWTERLSLRSLDISDNQIAMLPEHIIENSVGQPVQITIHAYGNPIDHDQLRRFWLNDRGYDMTYRLEYDFPEDIRDLVVDTTSSDDESSSDDEGRSHGHGTASGLTPPVPSLDIWTVPDRLELNSKLRLAWQSVEAAGDAPNLLVLLQRLREAPDFRRFHEELANDVMRVLEAAAEQPALRAELEIMADDRLFGAHQTCEDGARLIFSDIQVAVYSRRALQGVPGPQQTESLFRVIRNLYRLNEVQALADFEIASRESQNLHVDAAEVRLAYRIGLADDLNLPGQPLSMAWHRLAAVDRQAILRARQLVLEREAGPGFVDYAVADRHWNEHLRAEHQADLARVVAPVRAQMDALQEHPPVDAAEELRQRGAIYERLTAAHASGDQDALRQATLDLNTLTASPPVDNDEYDRQGRALMARLAAAEQEALRQLTSSMRQQWF
jgi:hypothetical protein